MGCLIEDRSLRNRLGVFRDRSDAGQRLAGLMDAAAYPGGLVLAIPAGGVPVAHEVARILELPLDVMIVRKVQLPDNTEAGFGAIGPTGEVILNEQMVDRLGLSEAVIARQTEKTRNVLDQRNRLYRQGRPFPVIEGRAVILVDDGLASGYTMRAAVIFARRAGASRIAVAVPTAPLGTIEELIDLVDEIYCPNVRTLYPFAVASAYLSWHDLSDEEVLSVLRS